MHTAEDIREAARRANCQVLELRQIDTQVGRIWTADLSCVDSYATFVLLRELAKRDEGDPEVRSLALGLTRTIGHDPKKLARAVQSWIQKSVWYVKEPKETFQSSAYTKNVRAGDCDDHATLAHVMNRNLGLESRIAGLAKTVKGERQIRHAVAQVKLGDRWHWQETTVPAWFGEHPLAAVRRVKAKRSDIEGAELGDLLPTVVTPDDARRYISETDAGWKRLAQDVDRSSVDENFRGNFATDLAAWVLFRDGASASVGWLDTKAVMEQTDRWVEKLDGWRRSLRGEGEKTTGPDPVPAGQGVVSRLDTPTKWILGVSLGVAGVAAAGYLAHQFRVA